jgi:hypothetical protein
MVVLVVVPGRAVALGELGVIMAAGAMGWDFFPRLPGVLMSGVGGHGPGSLRQCVPDTDATRHNLYMRTCEHIAIASKLQ